MFEFTMKNHLKKKEKEKVTAHINSDNIFQFVFIMAFQ